MISADVPGSVLLLQGEAWPGRGLESRAVRGVRATRAAPDYGKILTGLVVTSGLGGSCLAG